MLEEPKTAGLFEPGSVTWKVHASPLILVGGLRSLLISALHPRALTDVLARVSDRERPLLRVKRTAQYVTATTFGDAGAAHAAGAAARELGDEDTLLWLYCVHVHSLLSAYQSYGSARLDEDERERYLAEAARAAPMIGVPAERVPHDVAGMREYFASVRDELDGSSAALTYVHFVAHPPMTRDFAAVAPAMRIASAAAIGLVPSDLRRMAGIERPWVTDAAAFAAVAAAAKSLSVAMHLPLAEAGVDKALRTLAPSARPTDATP